MDKEAKTKLRSYLSPLGAWAFAIGTSVGWGSLVVTSNTYLAKGGIAGSVIGLLLGAMIMLIISFNYAYMIKCYPGSGGVYDYCKEAFGYDHGFLTAWFLVLTYLAMLWANATSLPLFARYFIGPVFQFGKMYSLFGYDVYFGEALLSIAAILVVSYLCSRSRKGIAILMILMAVFFTVGITVCFAGTEFNHGLHFYPAFVPGESHLSQIIRIAAISPWAFIGFESISHSSEEYGFRHNKIFGVLLAAVISTTLLYLFVTFMSASAFPVQYDNWLDYIHDIGNLSGLEALPAFYASQHYLGQFGVVLLMGSLLSLIFTSLVGNITALSRLLYALGRDEILPEQFGKLNKQGIPSKAILLVALVSVIMPFVGRTAIGWIVDITTFGAIMTYGFVSYATMKTAAFRNDKYERTFGLIGLIIMVCFGIYVLLPNLFSSGDMETESYFLFVVWAVLGFIMFRIVLKKDQHKRFGKSIIVWIALLSLILFVSLVWMNQSIMNAANKGMVSVANSSGDETVIIQQMAELRRIAAGRVVVVVGLFALSLWVLLNNYRMMSRKAEDNEMQLYKVRESAYTDPLTGVKSKLAYAEKEKELDEMIQKGEAEEFALVICDVNGLKVINDTQGHKAGDEYLRKACRLICLYFDHSPVYRTGGDEFVVILSGQDYENRNIILKNLHDTSVLNIKNKSVVISAGMAEYVKGRDETLRSLFEKADALMYEEKKYLKSMGANARI
ncbi:MAG: amino acid permease [Erysipelotrichaceae bacterium]|nr:amino acid permease [Erysipelotrichaceae bacterium]